MGGATNNGGGTRSGRLTRDVSDVSAADAEIRQFPFAEAFKLSDGLVVREPSLNLCENKRHQHRHGYLCESSNGAQGRQHLVPEVWVAPHHFSLHRPGFGPDAGGHAERGGDDHGKSPSVGSTKHVLQTRARLAVIKRRWKRSGHPRGLARMNGGREHIGSRLCRTTLGLKPGVQVGPEGHGRKRLNWHGPSPVLSNTDDPERFRECSCEEHARVCCVAAYRSEHMTYAQPARNFAMRPKDRTVPLVGVLLRQRGAHALRQCWTLSIVHCSINCALQPHASLMLQPPGAFPP